MSKSKPIKPDGGHCGTSDCPYYDNSGFCNMTGSCIIVDSASKDKLHSTYPCKPWAEMKARDYTRSLEHEREAYEDRRSIERQLDMHNDNVREKTMEIRYANEEIKRLEAELVAYLKR